MLLSSTPPQDARRRALLHAFVAGASATPLLAYSQVSEVEPKLDVPYVPTPDEVVDRMLRMAAVRARDVVYDLGCGDGRIVVTAARRHGARGVGIDLNPRRIEEAEAHAQAAGVADKVQFRVADLFETDVSPATVVTLYLLPEINRRLRPRLWKQLRVGSRVVSHAFDMGPEWPPERMHNAGGITVYAWTIRPEHKSAAG